MLKLGKYSKRQFGSHYLFTLLAFLALNANACSPLYEYFGIKDKKPQPDTRDKSYTWANFFNNNCGPITEFINNENGEAKLVYKCSNGKEVTQSARRHRTLNRVELWVTNDLPLEQLYELSNSKCRASLMYLGPQHATIKYPCALVYMTVAYDVVDRKTSNHSTRIQLKPQKVLITYGDGIKEFKVKEERLIPTGPFEPFSVPKAHFTQGKAMILSSFVEYKSCSSLKSQLGENNSDD